MYDVRKSNRFCLGFEHLNLAEYGKTIVKTTTQSTGIPVSIGIAKTKTLAKLAKKLAKKIPENKGVCLLDIASCLAMTTCFG